MCKLSCNAIRCQLFKFQIFCLLIIWKRDVQSTSVCCFCGLHRVYLDNDRQRKMFHVKFNLRARKYYNRLPEVQKNKRNLDFIMFASPLNRISYLLLWFNFLFLAQYRWHYCVNWKCTSRLLLVKKGAFHFHQQNCIQLY